MGFQVFAYSREHALNGKIKILIIIKVYLLRLPKHPLRPIFTPHDRIITLRNSSLASGSSPSVGDIKYLIVA
jgi:hypothetical protein